MIRILLIILFAASAAKAQTQDSSPMIEVAVDPSDPVTVGTAVEVSITVLVPTFMPDPPVWPDLQIANAITQLPDRATKTVTRQIERKSWSGLTRIYEITPQTAADFKLNGTVLTVTYADPDSHHPQQVELTVPDIAFSAVLPKGAEGLDPFIAAQSLTLSASTEGLTAAPKPGDAFTLTLTTTATGTKAMLLPPLSERVPTPQGLRAYPRQPDLSDTPATGEHLPMATRTEQISFVVEGPGSYTLPGLSFDWWNLGSKTIETVSSDPITFEVQDTLGHEAAKAVRSGNLFVLFAAALATLAAVAALLMLWRNVRRRKIEPGPSERALFRQLKQAVQQGPVQDIRPSLRRWVNATEGSDQAMVDADVEDALNRLERAAFGPDPRTADKTERARLLSALSNARPRLSAPTGRGKPGLPGLNPSWTKSQRKEVT